MNVMRNSLRALMVLCFSATTFFSFSQTVTSHIQQYLDDNRESLGLTSSDIENWRITSDHLSKQTHLHHIYVSQEVNGLEAYGATAVFVQKDGEVILTGNRFVPGISEMTPSNSQTLSEEEAIYASASALNLEAPFALRPLEDKNAETRVFSAEGLSQEAIPVRLTYVLDENELKLAWKLSIYEMSSLHWWDLLLDAETGEIIRKTDWVVSCSFDHDHTSQSCSNSMTETNASVPNYLLMPPPPPPGTDQYNVFALPLESPNHGPRSLVVGPYDPTASPFGWHDVDGIPGEEYTITQGNNVYATEDQNDNNGIGYSPDGGASLNFDFPLDLNQPTNTFLDAAITNLFYMNNMMHDIWYHYGFDEASGNFQENNYGNGGAGSDYVNADAQDGGGTNNANFATPDDGSNPRMQMYLWSPTGGSDLLTVNSPSGLAGSYGAVEAGFGPGVPSTPITADLVLPIDNDPDVYDACTDPVTPGLMNGKIALIMRGTCPFVDKVQRAQDDGAIAAIIINNVGTAPFAMGGTSSTINIPSVMISNADGLALIAEIENGGTINVTLVNSGVYALDGDFDNGIIAHEYGHGISNRLTGGGNNSSCLGNAEQMGEGWSDWFAIVMTIEPGDLGTDVRGMGTYASGDPITGNGIRPAPYSTDPNVNNFTYSATNNNSISQPHGIGFVWATMLWDMTWDLIDQYGFDPDLISGTGGNNIAMNLVTNALKLQPCSPGFVDGRDAILQADQLLYNGAHECLIWNAFANRGLGYSADQGDSDSRSDQVQAFDLPPGLDPVTTVTTCGTYTWSVDGQTYSTSGTYTAPLTGNACSTTATLDLTITPGITNTSVVQNGSNLTASQPNLNYQWIDCETGTPLTGETNQSLIPSTSGNYAVILSLGTCSDTSECTAVTVVGLDENDFSQSLVVYPNPTGGKLSIEFSEMQTGVETRLLDMSGRSVLTKRFDTAEKVDLYFEGQSGIYFLEIINAEGQKAVLKIDKL